MINQVKLFEQQKVRTHWDEEKQQWYFSIVDVIQILSESNNSRRYWSDLKRKLQQEGFIQLYEIIVQLKLESSDGKKYSTDCTDTKNLLRIIQSIPSPKAEPFKSWLAKVGYERMQEITDPEQSLDRARENWQKLGRSEKCLPAYYIFIWNGQAGIQQRMTGQETRNKLTDYWKESGVEKSDEFAFLTNVIHTEWAGLSVKKHKDLKGLKTQNLRDHMTEAELIFTALAELSTRQIAETEMAKGLKQNATAGMKGGRIAKDARLALENKTGRKVITGENFLPPVYEKKKINKK